jgi:type IV pilus assembly protein PilM
MRFALRELIQLSRNVANRFAQPSAIGLFLGRDSVNLVQMEETDKYLRVRALAAIPMPNARVECIQHPQRLRDTIRRAKASHPFAGSKVVSSLSAQVVKISMMDYKRLRGQSDEQCLVAELRERMGADLDEMVVDFINLRQNESETEVGEALVAMAPKRDVVAYLEALTAAGLNVQSLDVGPNALARVVRHSGAQNWSDFPKLPNALVMNVGEHSSFLSVIWGRRLILDRPIQFSESRLVARLVAVLGMTDDLARHLLHHLEGPSGDILDTKHAVLEVLHPEIQSLQQEINKTLVYMASKTRGKSVDVIHLVGSATRYPSLLAGLEKALQVPIMPVNPIGMFAVRAADSMADPTLGMKSGIVMATGLALREFSERPAWI